MATISLDVGLLFSTTGTYRTLGQAQRAGCMLAVEHIRAEGELPVDIRLHPHDPGGMLPAYWTHAQQMLRDQGITHVIGCYTSASRKEILPLFEKFDGLLWYPSHYEGFETSDNAIYMGAAPNQHVVPMTRYMLQKGGRRIWLTGSNYIWAWENNRIIREAVQRAGGEIVGERYFQIGDTDIDELVEQILEGRPDFIFNNMIGDTSYAFFRRLRARAAALGIDQPRQMPVLSCSLSEPELVEIGPEASDGHLCSSVYFESAPGEANRAFVEGWRAVFGHLGPTSADAETAYNAMQLLARAVAAAGTADLQTVREVISSITLNAPQGLIRVDAENRHCYMRPRIGRSTADGQFDLVYEAPAPLKPDPYLVYEDADSKAEDFEAPRLRLVP